MPGMLLCHSEIPYNRAPSKGVLLVRKHNNGDGSLASIRKRLFPSEETMKFLTCRYDFPYVGRTRLKQNLVLIRGFIGAVL